MARQPLFPCVILVSCLATSAFAGPIDFSRTAGGGNTPASNLVMDSATPWELFDQPLAASAPSGFGYAFSEPGMGNAIGQARGQMLTYRNVGQRHTRIIMDILAWVPVAQMLYLDPFQPIPSDTSWLTAQAGYIPVNLAGGGPVRSGRSSRSWSFASIVGPGVPPGTPGETGGGGLPGNPSGGSNPPGNNLPNQTVIPEPASLGLLLLATSCLLRRRHAR